MNIQADKHAIALLMAVVAAVAPGCSDSYDEAPRLPVIQNIVEYTGTGSGVTTFTWYAPGSNEPTTLRAEGEYRFDDIESGDALLLGYAADPSAPTSITPLNYRRINNLALQQSDAEGLAGWDAEGVYLHSAWLAGSRLNLRLELTYDTEPRRFAIIVDKSTLDDSWPCAYLYHKRSTDTPGFSREYYASCTVGALFSRPHVEGLTLYLLDTNTASQQTAVRTLSFPNPLKQ